MRTYSSKERPHGTTEERENIGGSRLGGKRIRERALVIRQRPSVSGLKPEA